MTRLVHHEPADLVATVEAGLTFAEFQTTIGRAGQWLPIDPPDDGRATVGGVVATGMGGAQAYGYGPLRGFVLGLRAVLADGRQIKMGGNVVKNVAGYDLCKLFNGSYGTLGLITELTFKLRPRPARTATLLVQATDIEDLFNGARQLCAGKFLPAAVELLSPPLAAAIGIEGPPGHFALLLRFAGTTAAVVDQAARARALFPHAAFELCEPDEHFWRTLAAQPLAPEHKLIWRACVRPTELRSLIADTVADREQSFHSLHWHTGLGDGRLRMLYAVEQGATQIAESLTQLRNTTQKLGGSLVIERAPNEVKQLIDVWGLRTTTAQLMQRVQQQLDPAAHLSPGRFFNNKAIA